MVEAAAKVVTPPDEPPSKPVAVIDHNLKRMEPNLKQLLPEGVSVERFIRICVLAAQSEPKLLTCNRQSFYVAALECAQDGLVPDGREAAFIPFKGEVAYVPMYPGLLKRARELGEILSVVANCVYANDEFVPDEINPEDTIHKRPTLGQPRGELIGAYAIFRDRDGRIVHQEIMDRGEIDKIRNFSKAKSEDSPWNQWFDAMARKCPIRRGSKFVPLSDPMRRIVNRDDRFIDIKKPGEVQEPRQIADVGQMLDSFAPTQHPAEGQQQSGGGDTPRMVDPEVFVELVIERINAAEDVASVAKIMTDDVDPVREAIMPPDLREIEKARDAKVAALTAGNQG